ncbi:hypothetical protein [Nocardia sp. NPDC051463]|uniref:hypothetical protein n=1 Tax=Nocardia sp. NPDC051463 TaxID=3154845 RepID=UPI00341A2FE6
MVLAGCPPDRLMSAAMFGNRYRLELLVALAESGEQGVNLSELAEARTVAPSVYYGPIRDLLDAGLVERLGRTAGDRRRWYRRCEYRFWDVVLTLAQELAEVEVEAS